MQDFCKGFCKKMVLGRMIDIVLAVATATWIALAGVTGEVCWNGEPIHDRGAFLVPPNAAFLPQVDGVLLVADGTRTVAEEIAACERVLDGQTQVLGVILNRARTSGSKEYDT